MRFQVSVWEVSRHEAWSVKGKSLWASGGRARALDSQPPELRIEALEEIRRRGRRSGRRWPSSTTTRPASRAHGVPVLTTWAIEDLRWALEQTSPTFYILTNSRSLAEEEAIVLNQQIARNLSEAAAPGTDFDVVSRSDSTLRGHYPAETDALAEVLREEGVDPTALSCAPLSSRPAGSRWTTSTGCARMGS